MLKQKNMNYTISNKSNEISGEINIPASKSISNRALIIQALNYSFNSISNLSDCDDTNHMINVLNSNSRDFNIGHAGTAMRFLTAYLSKVVGEWTITGSERMKERPIKILVDALNSLGAQITYLEKEGFPPIKICGSNITGREINLSGSISSQYISALLLIAPSLENGLKINLTGKVVSKTYIKMTLSIMKEYGISSSFIGNTIYIKNQDYNIIPFSVEGDWSGASYWYSMVALSEKAKLKLNGLKKVSHQGDSALMDIFSKIGVKTSFNKKGMFIERIDNTHTSLIHDFTEIPDLAQTFCVCCCLKNIKFHFKGLETLKIKETNRIFALITELSKLGYKLHEPAEGELAWDGSLSSKQDNIKIETYNDHRMALSFAPACLVMNSICIDSPEVVTKSYPNFWEQLKDKGFTIE